VPSPDQPSPDATVADVETIDTLLAFLTTSCGSCRPYWERMAAAGFMTELGAQLAVVTPSKSMENERLAQELLPPGAHLHMGSETWFEYGVGLSSSFVLVRSPRAGPPPWRQPGQVLGSATAPRPEELVALVTRWRSPRDQDS
jgi:hypothetical protein